MEEKMELVKKTLSQILDYLGENDRISLIRFNTTAERLCPLLKVTDANK